MQLPSSKSTLSSSFQRNKFFYFVALIILIIIGLSIFILGTQQKKIAIPSYPTPSAPQATKKDSPNKCFILGREFPIGNNPQNECQKCDTSIVGTAWVDKDTGTACQNKQGVCQKGQCVPRLTPAQKGSGGAKGAPPAQ